jgi:hypothetical protein
MDKIEALFAALVKSSFRSRFNLSGKEANYLKEKGLEAVLEHARGFIEARLAPASPSNDGRQTPTKNHPVFIAQHATATCCRKCLVNLLPKNRSNTSYLFWGIGCSVKKYENWV